MKKKFLAFLLVAVLAASSVLAGCSGESGDSSSTSSAVDSVADSTADESATDESAADDGVDYELPTTSGTYTYKDAVSTLATNWNPHTYQTIYILTHSQKQNVFLQPHPRCLLLNGIPVLSRSHG